MADQSSTNTNVPAASDDDFDFESFYHRKRVVITGGAGFIGSHLARRLAELNAEVRIIDDLSGGRRENLRDLETQVRFTRASILEKETLADVMRHADLVFHEAALASVPASIDAPRHYHDVNINGTLGVLEAARAENVKRIVFASSSSVYGDLPSLPKYETDLPDPLSPYAMQKLTGEHLMTVWARCYGMCTISLRYFNIFGPGQSADSAYAAVVAAFAKALLNGEAPRIFGDGSATRDFTCVDNVVQANLRAGAIDERLLRRRLANRPAVFNIACGVRTSVKQLAEAMIEIVGAEVEPEFGPPRPGDVLHSAADIALAREVLGYTPTVGLEAGLRPTMEWYQQSERPAAGNGYSK